MLTKKNKKWKEEEEMQLGVIEFNCRLEDSFENGHMFTTREQMMRESYLNVEDDDIVTRTRDDRGEPIEEAIVERW